MALLVLHVRANRDDYGFVASLDWAYLLPIALLSLGRLVLEALRFSATATAAWKPFPFRQAFSYLVIGRLLNKFIPQSGLAYKARMLYSAEAATPRDIVTVLGTLAWMQIFITLMITLAAVAVASPELAVAGTRVRDIVGMLLAMMLAGTTALVIWAFRSGGAAAAPRGRLRRMMAREAVALRRFLTLSGKFRLLVVSALTIGGAILLAIARVLLAFRMLGEDPGIGTSAVFVLVNRLATMITITPGNLGVTELAYGGLAGELGIGVAQGVTAALIIRVVMLLTLAHAGFAVWLLDRLRPRMRRSAPPL